MILIPRDAVRIHTIRPRCDRVGHTQRITGRLFSTGIMLKLVEQVGSIQWCCDGRHGKR